MTLPTKPAQPRTDVPWVNNDGRLSLPLAQYFPQLDALVTALAQGHVGTLINAANDAAAARAGVAVGSMYRNGSQLLIRVT